MLVLQVMCHTEHHTQATHWVIWNPALELDPPSTVEYQRSSGMDQAAQAGNPLLGSSNQKNIALAHD